jgi:hypothetical protein
MMSRLQSTDPTLSEPTDPGHTDIPCFVVSHREDPTLISVETFREHQRCDPQYDGLMSHWGWSDSLDMDSNGVIGYVCPTGEFEVIIPDTIPREIRSRLSMIFTCLWRMTLTPSVTRTSRSYGGGYFIALPFFQSYVLAFGMCY